VDSAGIIYIAEFPGRNPQDLERRDHHSGWKRDKGFQRRRWPCDQRSVEPGRRCRRHRRGHLRCGWQRQVPRPTPTNQGRP
jgi:hypothetical protein